MTRLTLGDSAISMMMKLSDGNPGALSVLTESFKNDERIDPDSIFGKYGAMMLLDSFEIYGTDIYVLYNDICNRDVVNFLAVLRATQLGLFSHRILKDACSRQDRSGRELVPVEDLYLKVKETLPNFNSQPA